MSARRADMISAELDEARASGASVTQQLEASQQRTAAYENKCRGLESRVAELQDIGLSAKAVRLENELERSKADARDGQLKAHDLRAELERERADRALDAAGYRRTKEDMEKVSLHLQDANNKLVDALASDDRQKRLVLDLRAQVAEHTSRCDDLETRAAAERHRAKQAMTEKSQHQERLSQLESDHVKLQRTLQDREDVLTGEQARWASEKESAGRRYTDLEEQLKAAVAEARERELLHGDARRATEARFQYKVESLDTQYVQLQKEYENMHGLLLRVQQENKDLTGRIDAQRIDAKDSAFHLSEALKASDERMHTAAVRSRAELTEANDRERTLQQRLVTMMDSFVNTQEAMQSQMDRLRKLTGHVSGDCELMRKQTEALRARCDTASESIAQPLAAFSNETKGTLLRLANRGVGLQNELEDARDQLVATSLQRDTEHGKCIMQAEEIDRLKYDMGQAAAQRAEEMNHTTERLRASGSELTTAQTLVVELEARVGQYIDQLTAANGQNAQLQEQCQQTREALRDAKDSHQREYDDIKRRLDQSDKVSREARAVQEEMGSELHSALRQLEMESQRNGAHAQERAELERAHADAETRIRRADQVHASKVKQLKDELHTLHEQLETTQQLYGKVRDGRDMLREELGEMKAEMTLYHKNVQAGIKVVEKGPMSGSPRGYGGSPSAGSSSSPKKGDDDDDSKVDSPNSGKSEDSFTIDDIRAEFEGFDGF